MGGFYNQLPTQESKEAFLNLLTIELMHISDRHVYRITHTQNLNLLSFNEFKTLIKVKLNYMPQCPPQLDDDDY